MGANNPEEQHAFERCRDALAMCKSLSAELIDMQNRFRIGVSVKATMEHIEWDLQALNERIDDLTNELLEEVKHDKN